MSYTKLFSSIITSTIWTEDDRTRIIWITMLALADKNGEVQASIPGLAQISGTDTPSVETALAKFLAPDEYSRTPDDQGRRVEPIPGGWLILNHGKYRQMATDEDRKEKAAERQKRFRDRQKRNASVTPPLRQIPQAEAEAEAKKSIEEAKASSQGATAPVWDELWRISPPLARKRSSKKQCKGAWGTIPASTRPSLEKATEALRAWMRDDDWRKENGKFIPGLHRWIANRQWENIDDIKNTTKAGIRARRKVSAAEMGL